MLTGLVRLIDSLTTHLAPRDENGQALVEYGLLMALIAAVCIVVLGLLGGSIATLLQSIANAL
jgi:pilus assembly protein Flp/PilA